jgi:hypothetical protein
MVSNQTLRKRGKFLDMEGVRGSIPLPPTINANKIKYLLHQTSDDFADLEICTHPAPTKRAGLSTLGRRSADHCRGREPRPTMPGLSPQPARMDARCVPEPSSQNNPLICAIAPL